MGESTKPRMTYANNWLRRAINFSIDMIKRTPYVMYLSWRIAPYFTFLLPHEKDYFGLKYLIEGDDGLLLDVGANSGISALGFRKLGIPYRILSIEADRYHEPALLRVQRRIPNFEYRIIGAGRERTRVTLYTPKYNGVPIHTMTSAKLDYAKSIVARDYSKRISRKMKYSKQEVEIIPLDDLNLDPKIIKIDVEGLDFEVLQGLRKTIIEHRPYLVLEYTPNHMGGSLTFLDSLDYVLYVYEIQNDRFQLFDLIEASARWQRNRLQVNLFCVPAEKSAALPT